MERVRIERHASTWTIVVDHPPANALDLETAQAMGEALATAERSDDCRGVVVTGAGRFFSGGIDVKAVPEYDAATRARMLRTVNATMARLYGLPKPVVAAVNGHALGGALVLALAADVRLAAAGDHRLGLTEAAAGIAFPAVPLLVVEAEVTQRAARLATLAAVAMGPDDAAAMGFVDAVLPARELLPAALARVDALAALPAFAAVKAQLRRRTLARMHEVVRDDDEPLLRGWMDERA
jgi:enoyl-CoA hydratase